MLLDQVDYTALPAKVSQQVLLNLDRNWKSFFASIKDWVKNPSKYNGRPKLPKYKHKTKGRFVLNYTSQAVSKTELRKGFVKLSLTNIKIKYINNQYPIRQVRIVPLKNKNYKVEIIYDRNIVKYSSQKHALMSIDLGVNNFATITTNQKGVSPMVIKGGILKSINQYYNKQLSKYKSELPYYNFTNKDDNTEKKQVSYSNKIYGLTRKRNNKINYWMHLYSKRIVEYCLKNNIGEIVVGVNKGWKQETEMGKKNNQNFVTLPYSKFRQMLEYKTELAGIKYKEQEESYTSKASFLNLDPIPVYRKNNKENYKFSGYRVSGKRGLYKIKNNTLPQGKELRINSDVNGSYNILRKAFPNEFSEGIEGIVVCPVIFDLDQMHKAETVNKS
jgi:putative transposase